MSCWIFNIIISLPSLADAGGFNVQFVVLKIDHVIIILELFPGDFKKGLVFNNKDSRGASFVTVNLSEKGRFNSTQSKEKFAYFLRNQR